MPKKIDNMLKRDNAWYYTLKIPKKIERHKKKSITN